jgi:hypothetical protein
MAANPRIQRLGQELIALYMADGHTCEEDMRGRRACHRVPEYRYELGPFAHNPFADGLQTVNVSKDVCPVHARGFAKTFNLRLPSPKAVKAKAAGR